MRKYKRLSIILLLLVTAMLLSACREKAEKYELTEYVGKTISVFEKKTGLKLEKQENGTYLAEGIAQVISAEDRVTSVTLLDNAGQYSFFGVKIGMQMSEAEVLLKEFFGKEITKTIDSDKNSVTYSYLKNEKELYVSYDISKNTVKELYYNKKEATGKNEATQAPVNAGELMAIIGDTKVYYNEAMVYLKSAQENYETEYGKGIWDADILGNGETFGKMLKDEVINQITELKIIRAEAEKLEINLTEDELADASSYAKEHYEGLTQADKNKYLVTQELLKQVYEDNLLAEKVFETLTINVDSNVSDAEAKQVTVQHILVYSTDFDEKGNKVALSAAEKEAAYEKARTLLVQAKETEDFYALAEANSAADTIEYTFGRGQGPQEYSASFEQAAFTLKTGQVSELVTTDYGWHILYCVTDFNEDATIQAKERIIEQRRNDSFSELYAQWSGDYDVVINNEAWDGISLKD